MNVRQTPSAFLKAVAGQVVLVKTNYGEYRGVLGSIDGYMNIALEQTEEYDDGKLKMKHGDCFLRGNSVVYLAVSKKRF